MHTLSLFTKPSEATSECLRLPPIADDAQQEGLTRILLPDDDDRDYGYDDQLDYRYWDLLAQPKDCLEVSLLLPTHVHPLERDERVAEVEAADGAPVNNALVAALAAIAARVAALEAQVANLARQIGQSRQQSRHLARLAREPE